MRSNGPELDLREEAAPWVDVGHADDVTLLAKAVPDVLIQVHTDLTVNCVRPVRRLQVFADASSLNQRRHHAGAPVSLPNEG
jgi:hypothetical protein